MKRILLFLWSIGFIVFIAWGGLKLSAFDFEKRANERIEQVIKLQQASVERKHVLVDSYDYKNGCWYQRIVFNDDPDITYDYEYTRSANEVRVFAMYQNMSLDLAKKQAKYPVYNVHFNKDKVEKAIKR